MWTVLRQLYQREEVEEEKGKEDEDISCGISQDSTKCGTKRQRVSSETNSSRDKNPEISSTRKTSIAVLKSCNSHVVHVLSLRGNFWRTMGHNKSGINLLYLEEALFLLEKHQLCIYDDTSVRTCSCDINFVCDHIPIFSLRHFYEHTMNLISLECYLAYLKLRSLDYVVCRSTPDVRLCGDEMEVIASYKKHLTRHRHHILIEHPDVSEEPVLLNFMTSYDIYLVGDNYTKRNVIAGLSTPVAHVIVTSCPRLYSSKLLLTLLKQSEKMPCIFAVVTPHSGFVVLEELTDAETSLKWNFGDMNSSKTVCENMNNVNVGRGDRNQKDIGVPGTGKSTQIMDKSKL